MDLSIKRNIAESSETFDYRHKKFDHVRVSPTLSIDDHQNEHCLASPMPQKIEMNFYLSTQAKVKAEFQARDHFWERSIDEVNMPGTPSKGRRNSKRKIQDSAYVECPKAPKKRKVLDLATTTAQLSTPPATPTPVLMPKISNEALARICQYNKNMVRKFPKKERSAKDQERRDKNTIACRMSRRLKKLENLAIEEQYKIFVQEHLEQQKRAMQAAVYLDELIKTGAQLSPKDLQNDNDENVEFLKTITKNLKLKYLEECLMSETTTVSNHIVNQVKIEEQIVDVESLDCTESAAQCKRSFTIAFLLGSQQKS